MDEPGKAILAEGSREPSLYKRYRFFVSGVVPPGHFDWAERRLSPRLWVTVHLAVDLAVWALIVAAALTFDPFSGEVFLAVTVVAVLVTTPLKALRVRKRALKALAPPASAKVLESIGEHAPVQPGERFPPLR